MLAFRSFYLILYLVDDAMKIIVIDDHALMRELLLKACLEAVPGSRVLGAGTAKSGLALVQSGQPDLVILDLALPDRDGLELLNDLLAACSSSKVIGLSGYSDEFTLYQVTHSKLHGFVDKKEQTVEQLANAIQCVMDGKRYFFRIGPPGSGFPAERPGGLRQNSFPSRTTTPRPLWPGSQQPASRGHSKS